MYKEMFFMLDTCEAMTMFDEIEAPEIYMLASAVLGESALADKTDGVLNTFLADKFSAEFNLFLTQRNGYRDQTQFKLSDFVRLFTYEKILSHLVMKSTGSRPLSEVLLSDFLPADDKWMSDQVHGF
jgi:GPI-anchor transamidase subunit K